MAISYEQFPIPATAGMALASMEFTEDEKKQIVSGFVDIFFRIADKEYQKRVWIRGEGPEYDEFTDVTCDFFGECDSIRRRIMVRVVCFRSLRSRVPMAALILKKTAPIMM